MLRLSCRFEFLLLTLCVAYDILSLFGLKVIALYPDIVGPLGKLFLEVGDCINFVKVVEDFGLDLLFANFALCDP